MKKLYLTPSWLMVILAGATAAAAGVAVAAPEPLPAAVPANVRADGDLDAQLEAARKRLEEAAHEVAQLSSQLSGTVIQQVMPFEPGHAIIGVQLEPATGAAGARVREVSPGGPAAEAGVHVGDVIVAVNGTELKGDEPARQVIRIMRDVKPDARVQLRVLRDGKTRELTVTARPGPAALASVHGLSDLGFGPFPEWHGALMLHGPLMDMELATLTPRLGSYFGSDKGVLVVRAPADATLKLEDGDVILAIDGRQPTSGSHATRILSSYQPGEKLTLRIIRQHKTLEVDATLPEGMGRIRKDMMWREGSPHERSEPTRKVLILGRDEA
ncbi:MAG TPA: PDZ domain-containing protein [Steroidobacteraceae bacterium]|nr:PDZ domain-containing protein [Steroidobacteraceae bacterium]